MGDFNYGHTGKANVVLKSDQKTDFGIFINFFMEKFGANVKVSAILDSV